MSTIPEVSSKAFKEVVYKRRAVKGYKTDAIPDETLQSLLEQTQRAPSSLNTQQYKAIVVRGEEGKQALADTMLPFNVKIVQDAAVSVVFLADLEPVKGVEHVQKLYDVVHGSEGLKAYVPSLPSLVQYFAHDDSVEGLPDTGLALEETAAKTPEAWAFRVTGMAAQTFMLAATSYGLASTPIEGYDAAKLRKSFNIPTRYGIAMVVAAGYEDTESTRGKHVSPRLPATDVFSLDTFGGSSESLFTAP